MIRFLYTAGSVSVWARISTFGFVLFVLGCGENTALDADEDGYPVDVDCDDSDATINPGVAELCDGIDNNCDGAVDEGAVDAVEAYQDLDGDGFGLSTVMENVCDGTVGWSLDNSDCDDLSDAVYPGAPEACDDGVVNDCDLVFCDEDTPVEGCITPEDYCGALTLDSDGSELSVTWSSDCILQVTDELGSSTWGDFGGMVDQQGCVRQVRRDVSDAAYFRLRVP